MLDTPRRARRSAKVPLSGQSSNPLCTSDLPPLSHHRLLLHITTRALPIILSSTNPQCHYQSPSSLDPHATCSSTSLPRLPRLTSTQAHRDPVILTSPPQLRWKRQYLPPATPPRANSPLHIPTTAAQPQTQTDPRAALAAAATRLRCCAGTGGKADILRLAWGSLRVFCAGYLGMGEGWMGGRDGERKVRIGV
jgi:hypothetical protein